MDLLNFARTAPLSYTSALKQKRQRLQCDDSFVSRLDRVQELGSEEDDSKPGHVGCVNALTWSRSGGLLASGSDDFRVCLWRAGIAQGTDAFDPVNDIEGVAPVLAYGLESMIHTGHRRSDFLPTWALEDRRADRKLQQYLWRQVRTEERRETLHLRRRLDSPCV